MGVLKKMVLGFQDDGIIRKGLHIETIPICQYYEGDLGEAFRLMVSSKSWVFSSIFSREP